MKRGFDAVAMTVMRYRCSASLTFLLDLLPGLAGGHEHHFVQAELGRDLTGRDKVAVMDGIERAAHHTQTQAALARRAASVAAEILVALAVIVLVRVLAVRVRVLLDGRVALAQVGVGQRDEHQDQQDREHRRRQ